MIQVEIRNLFKWSQVSTKEEQQLSGFFTGELLALRPPPKLTVSEWADAKRILQAGPSRYPGPWSTSTTPYLKEVMDAYNDPHVRHIVLCFGTQLGKTECLYNILGYIIDEEPYSTLLIYPRENDAKAISRTRLQPMIEDIPSLRAKKPLKQDLYQTLEMHFPGMILYLVGANSPAALAQKPCRNILRDEIDKYLDHLGKEADPLSLSEERTKSFWDIRKIVDVSSPSLETVGIWKELQSCDEIRERQVACPRCGGFQKLEFDQIKWDAIPEGAGCWTKKAQIAKNTARYICRHCKEAIGSNQKASMLYSGKWVAVKKSLFRPEKIGFQLSSFYSPWLTWGDIAEKFMKTLQAKEENADLGPLKNFVNGWKAEPWKTFTQDRKESAILALKENRPRGLVPSEGVLGITAGIDTQDDCFYYVVRAWGRFDESWLIREGKIEDYDALLEIVLGRFQDVSGKDYIVNLGFQDAMGHRTSEVYEKLRGIPQLKPIKGEQRMETPYTVKRVDTYPGTNKPIPGGLRRYHLNSNYYKDKLFTKLGIAPADPGSFHLHAEVTEDYARQMVAEFINEKELWECPQGKANHYWDCEYLALAAADVLGIRHWKGASEDPGRDRQEPAHPVRSSYVQKMLSSYY